MKDNRVKIFLIVLAAAAAAAAAAYIWFWHLVNTANDESSYLRGDIALQVQRNETAGALEKLINETEADRRQIDSYFVAADRTVDFVEYLESLARVAGVAFEISLLGVEQIKDDFKDKIILHGEAVGGWSPLLNFLSLLENAPQRLDLMEVVVTKQEKTNWEARILIETFQLKK